MNNIEKHDPHLFDDYEMSTANPEKFRRELEIQEVNSEWISGVPTCEMTLIPVIGLEAEQAVHNYGFDPYLCMETAAEDGSRLILSALGKGEMVRACAIDSIERAAGITGPALTRMNVCTYADTLNNCLEVVPEGRTSLMLKRYGKLASIHGDGKNGYAIMPVTELYDATVECLRCRFGMPQFQFGYNSHSATYCRWTLPKAQNILIQKYQEALDAANAVSNYAISFMPAVIFKTSDTSKSSAMLIPVFLMDKNRILYFTDGIAVKHLKNKEIYGCDAYRYELNGIFAKFDEAIETVTALASITIANPANCIVRLCSKFRISPCYGDSARSEIERLTNGAPCSAHDVYLAMSECLAEAEFRGASKSVITKLEESISVIGKITDWSEFDVGGTVAWKN